MALNINNQTLTNIEQLLLALRTMPMKDFCAKVNDEMARKAEDRIQNRPKQMGVTPGTKGESSTGNVPTAGKSFYKRDVGSFYMPSSRSKNQMVRQTGVSSHLQTSWRRVSDANGGRVEVRSFNVEYAGFVQGGKDDDPVQSSVMQRRGWETTDKVGEAIQKTMASKLAKMMVLEMQGHILKYGITATGTV